MYIPWQCWLCVMRSRLTNALGSSFSLLNSIPSCIPQLIDPFSTDSFLQQPTPLETAITHAVSGSCWAIRHSQLYWVSSDGPPKWGQQFIILSVVQNAFAFSCLCCMFYFLQIWWMWPYPQRRLNASSYVYLPFEFPFLVIAFPIFWPLANLVSLK